MGTTIFTEQLDLTEATPDREARTLKDVILIRAGVSLNKRSYSEAVLEKSVPIFEGARAFDSHVQGQRRVGELTGYYTNVRYVEGKLKADRHFTNTQAGRDVWSVVEDIVSGKAPKSLAGLSINAVGSAKPGKVNGSDVMEVESITSANSIDDVLSAAAGGMYRESATGDALAQALLEAMTIEEFTEARPDFIKRLQKEWKTMRDGELVKAAETDADQLRSALQEAQQTIERLETEREAAVTEAETARRELAIEQVLNDPKVKLPASWRESLRKQLQQSAPEQWGGIIEASQKLAASAGHKAQVAVSGAGQQIADAVSTPTRVDPLVRARRRIAEASSPDELLRIRESLDS